MGVDCFGPFLIRRGRSEVKRYGVLYTCLVVRAVHIEVSQSLDTDSFLNSFRRFVARRGAPEQMRSDNGGNFVSGESELRHAINNWNQEKIVDFLLQRNVQWIINPPAGSHYGGAWERCIQTVRREAPQGPVSRKSRELCINYCCEILLGGLHIPKSILQQ